MRFFIIILLATIFSCTPYKTNKESDFLDVPDTEMAEIKEPTRISKEDSLELLKAFRKFCEALSNEDGKMISEMSADEQAWPVSLNKLIDALPGSPNFLLSWPCKNLYKKGVWKMMNYWRPTISEYYGFKVTFSTLKKTKRFIAEIEHRFSFVKSDGQFKFDNYEESEMIRWDLYPSIDSITAYFPKTGIPGSRGQKKGFLSNFENIWYSGVLHACSEPVLYNYKGEEEIYRFSWFRSFHLPVVIRIEKKGFDFSLSAKMLWQAYDGESNTVWDSTQYSMSYFQWQIFKNRLNKAKFWEMPFEEDEERGMDGATWVMEAYKNGRYQFIRRWSPGATDFANACKYLITLSGLEIDKEDIY